MPTFDDHRIDFECPKCNATMQITLGEVRRSPTVTCPSGHEIHLEASDLDAKTKDVERALADLDRTFKNFGR